LSFVDVFAVVALAVALDGLATFVVLVAGLSFVALTLVTVALVGDVMPDLSTATPDAGPARGAVIACGAFIAPPAIATVEAQETRIPSAVRVEMSFMMALLLRMIAEMDSAEFNSANFRLRC
jgi:hypothetical protein